MKVGFKGVKIIYACFRDAGVSAKGRGIIMKTYLLKPHFYEVKQGFTGEGIFFLISAQKHRLWVLVRIASPRRF